MSSENSDAQSAAIYASLFFLCQTGPLPVAVTWSQESTKQPSRGILIYDDYHGCFFMNEFQLVNNNNNNNNSNTHQKNSSGMKVHRYPMGPGQEAPPRGAPASVTIQAFYNDLILVHMLPALAKKSEFTSEDVDLCLDKKRVKNLRAVLKNYMTTVVDSYEEAVVEPMLLHQLWSKQNFIEFNQLDITEPHDVNDIRTFLDECIPEPKEDKHSGDEEMVSSKEVNQRLTTLEEQMVSLTELLNKQRADTREILNLLRQQQHTAKQRAPSQRYGRTTSQHYTRAASQRAKSREVGCTSKLPSSRVAYPNCRTWGPLKERFPDRQELLEHVTAKLGITKEKLRNPANWKYYQAFKSAFFANINYDFSDPDNAEAMAELHRAMGQMTSQVH